jgi:3-polyprenyl-4-hydroxybenzoate decarboxylase
MYDASKLGAVVLPPMLTYYNHPKTLEECTRHAVNRILSQFDLDEDSYQWEGMDETV